jgi:16S rRNA (cytidine1402-2'-O)-methyltransferase
LVSEAGTPGISDPGNLLINYLHQENVCAEIIPIPGPCAAIAALSAAGFSADRFLFLGFLPTKNKRKKFLARISENMETTVFYESPYRILKTLEELTATIEDQNRRIFVGRELTKKFETSYRGTFQDIIAQVKTHPIKGEFVVVVEGRSSAASLV